MAASSSATPSNSFDLKSASLALVALVLRTTRLEELERQFEERIGPSAGFFDRDPVIIDLGAVAEPDEPVDFPGLCELMRRYSMVPVAVRGVSPAQLEAALAAGLCEAPASSADLPHVRSAPPPVPVPEPEPVASDLPPESPQDDPDRVEAGDTLEAAETGLAAQAADAAADGDAGGAANEGEDDLPPVVSTMVVIDRPLRSGQQVYAKNADLVVLALVSHGAEVIADGSIHVYAPLRGKAIAGATGDIHARIFSTCMEPELISVAGTYQTTDPPLPIEVRGKSAQVRLDGDTLVIEAIKA